MITKVPREDIHIRQAFNLNVADKNGNRFTMLVGGNGDLYGVPENHKKVSTFFIDQSDPLFFNILTELFEIIEKRDNPYHPSLIDNKFTFISEDAHEDEAHRLEITNTDSEFKIDFIKNNNPDAWSYPKLGCPICFCNSGSRVPRIEQLFMYMFNQLAYYDPRIEIEGDNNESVQS